MRILLPIDGSDCSHKTLEWATRFLNKSEARIHLLYVIFVEPAQGCAIGSDTYPVGWTPTDGDAEKMCANQFLEKARSLMEQNGLTVERALYLEDAGPPSSAICHYADANGIDQIVMGSHGRSGLEEFLMGSVAKQVFRQAKQPVIVLNTGAHPSLQVSQMDKVSLRME